MLSILIPTYHYNVLPLVNELHEQCLACGIAFEILVYDDGSKSPINLINDTINNIPNCSFKELPHNIGRSAIRNLLGKNAHYNLLLFMDAGTFPKEKNFIGKYIAVENEKVIFGGMTHLKNAPKKPFKLRWIYTKERESKTFSSSNFLIQKELFKSFPFDESIKKYGYEDVLFLRNLKNNHIHIHLLNNPVIHYPDDDAPTFLEKTEDALKNLCHLVEQGKLMQGDSKIYRYYLKINKFNFTKGIAVVFDAIKNLLILNLNSNYPSLFVYDLYRLGYFCKLKTKR